MAKERICGIYCITNTLNGKQYVGQSVDIYERWHGHMSSAISKDDDHTYIHRAMKKYGRENFKLEILEECSPEELNERQIYYISKLGTYGNGYNISPGGENGVWNEQYLEEYRNIRIKNGTVEELFQIDMQGNIVHIWPDIRAAVEALGVTYSVIYNAAVRRKYHRTAYGYIWRLRSDYEKNGADLDEAKRKTKAKPIIRISKDGELKHYSCSTQASTEIQKCSPEKICACAGGWIKTYRGYVWVYECDYDPNEDYSIRFYVPSRWKAVEQLDENDNVIKTYPGIVIAVKETGISSNRIIECAKGKRETAGGFKWRYVEVK